MIQVKHIKKVTSLLLILVTALVLVACTKKANVPYGSITEKDYLSLDGDIKITERDLYDSLRSQGSSLLSKLVNEKIFEGYLTNAEKLLKSTDEASKVEAEWANKIFDELVNQAIFSTTDIDSLKKLDDVRKEISIEKFVDTLYTQDNTVDRTDLTAKIGQILNDTESEDFATGYATVEVLVNRFAMDLAQRIFAKEKLTEEQDDKENDNFIKETQVINHYKNNVKDRHDVNVFYFYFLNANEANAALRFKNVKIDSSGRWFEIPDIRIFGWENNTEYSSEAIAYVEDVLSKPAVGLLDKSKQQSADDSELTKINPEEYKKYYDAYSPSVSSGRDTALSQSVVFSLFIELYNLVNIGKQLEPVAFTDVENKELAEYADFIKFAGKTDSEDLTETYADLNKLNSSFRSYIYDTLTTVDSEDTKAKPFSNLRSVGTFRYLAFKFDEVNPGINLVSEEKDADGNEQWATIEELKETYKDSLNDVLNAYPEANNDGTVNWDKVEELFNAQKVEWTAEVFNNKLTSSYTTTKVNELFKDNLTIEIYDPVLRIYYNQSAAVTAKGKDKTGNVLASVKIKLNDEEIKFDVQVDDFYALAEKSFGVTTGLDLLINKYLLKDEKELISASDRKEFETELKTLITNFSNDQFASAGYPASIGREAFLLLIFGADNNKEALTNGYIIPKLRELLLTDFEKQLSHLDVDLFDVLATYAGKQYTAYEGLTTSHLLVYFDENGDGTPEDPETYFEGMDDEEVKAIKENIVDLFELIGQELGQKDSITTGLSQIATEFQNTARISLNIGHLDNDIWQPYRALGINLKFEDLGSTITNTSNLITSSSTLDEVFYNRAMYLHDLVTEAHDLNDEIANVLPYLDFDSNSLNMITEHDILDVEFLEKENGDKPGIMSSFGFHFIVVTNVDKASSAKKDFPSNWEENKDDNDYTFKYEERYLSAYNSTSDLISKDQVEYYMRGSKLDEGVLLPSEVRTAFTKYFDPVKALFDGNTMQSSILFSLLETNNLNLHDKDARFYAIKSINTSIFHNYIISGNGTVRDENYNTLYGDWFKDFGLEK